MQNDDENARKARAEKLRNEIAKLTNPEGATESDKETGSDNQSPGESARHFVERRMREINQQGSK